MIVRAFALFALIALAAPAAAQDAAIDPAITAEHAFADGRRAHDEGRFAEALEHFARAQSIRPHDLVRFNIAVCLEHLGRLRAAWLEYRTVADSESIDDDARAIALGHASALEEGLAVLRVTASEAADVRLDGTSAGATPLETRVEPGPHVVTAHVGTREAHRDIVTERGGSYEVSLDLPPPLAPPPPVVRLVETRRALREPSWATWLGGGVALIGGAGIVGSGVHAQSLFDAYRASTEAMTPQAGA